MKDPIVIDVKDRNIRGDLLKVQRFNFQKIIDSFRADGKTEVQSQDMKAELANGSFYHVPRWDMSCVLR